MKTIARGFSLLELLVSMALGAFLLAGLLTIYSSNKKTYQLEESLARLQENGRLAIHFLNHDVRMAGYVGCPLISKAAIPHFSDSNRLMIWHAGQTIDPDLVPQKIPAAAGTDILFLQGLDPNTVTVDSIDNNNITVNGSTDFAVGDKLLISNCEKASAAEITRIFNTKNKQIITLNSSVAEYRIKTTEVGYFQKIIYYINKTTRKTQAGKAIYSLYRRDLNGPQKTPQELVEGITDMQLSLKDQSLSITLSLQNLDDHRLKSNWHTIIALREPL